MTSPSHVALQNLFPLKVNLKDPSNNKILSNICFHIELGVRWYSSFDHVHTQQYMFQIFLLLLTFNQQIRNRFNYVTIPSHFTAEESCNGRFPPIITQFSCLAFGAGGHRIGAAQFWRSPWKTTRIQSNSWKRFNIYWILLLKFKTQKTIIFNKSQYWPHGANKHVKTAENEKAWRTDGRTDPLIEALISTFKRNSVGEKKNDFRRHTLFWQFRIHSSFFFSPSTRQPFSKIYAWYNFSIQFSKSSPLGFHIPIYSMSLRFLITKWFARLPIEESPSV